MSAQEGRAPFIMADDAPPTTPLRHMLWLAWVLSAGYLAAGAAVAALHRLMPGHFTGLAAAMDMLSSSALQAVKLWQPLIHALASGRIEGWQLRVILVALSVGLIFTYALTLGLLLNLARALFSRRLR